MSDALTSTEPPGTPPKVRFAERWADFTKALAIYPEKSDRVRLNLAALHEALAELQTEESATPTGVVTLFHDRNLVDGDVELPIAEGSALAWLRTRLAHAGLAGVEFLPGLGDEALFAFSKQLLSNFLRKEIDPTVASLWPDTYEGLELIDRRFEGSFGGVKANGPYQGGRHSAASDGKFISGVLRHPKVARQLARIQAGVAGLVLDEREETCKPADLLKRMVDDLPVDAVADHDTLINSVCKVIDALARRISPEVETEVEGIAGSAFATLLQEVSRSHFAREARDFQRLRPGAEDETAPSGAHRAGDERITDEIGSFFEEFAELPAELAVDLDKGGAESAPEQLAVLLHYLLVDESSDALPSLEPALAKVLASPGPEEIQVLRAYLETPEQEGEASAPAPAPAALVSYLRRTDQLYLLRVCRAFPTERVVAAFPQHFGLFLACLDPEDPYDLEDLDAVCTAVGAQRMRSTNRAGADDLAQVPAGQLTCLLARSHPARLPLLHLLLRLRPEDTRASAAQFLRALDLPEPEAFLLYQVRDAKYLSDTYLLALIEHHLGSENTAELRHAVTDVLCHHIEDTAALNPGCVTRLESIRNLAVYPSARGWQMLEDLGRSVWTPFGRHEPAAVRKLARSISKEYKAA